jgi:putative FmdB family regulatory protein
MLVDMPIFDFSCRKCEVVFEALVRGSAVPVCPHCGSQELERMMSLPAIRSDATRSVVKRETKRRDASQAKERDHAQREYERNHD